MKKKKQWIQMFLVIVCVALLIGADWMFFGDSLQKTVTESVSPVLGIVVTVTEDDWQDALFYSIKTEAKQCGYEIMEIQAERSQAEQIEAIRALIVYRVDVIVLLPIVDSGWDAALSEAQEAAIPIITVDKGIQRGEQFAVHHVGYHYYADAVRLAEVLAADAQSDDIIIEIYGTLGSYSAKELTRGFRETLMQRGLKIHSSVSGDYMCSRGKEIAEGFLKSKEGVDYIIAHNDAMALGAVMAIEEQGRIPGQDVQIYAVGGGRESMELLDDGKLNGLIVRSTVRLGEEVIATAENLRQNSGVQATHVMIETDIRTKRRQAHERIR